jgi:monoterpene epsilon-lactone hydrolase
VRPRHDDLTATDRFWRTIARWIDKPVLRPRREPAALRVLFGISTRMGSALPRGATVIRDREDGLTITPQGVAKDAPVIFYIHGGGFTIGSPRTHAALAGHLAAHAGMRAYLPRYRLAPEHPFPAARDDVIARYTALCDTAPPAPSAATARAAASPCNWRNTSATMACQRPGRSASSAPSPTSPATRSKP